MPRPEFSQPGTEGGGQTVATQDRPEPIATTVTQTQDLAAGEQETVSITAPSGAIYRMIGFYFYAQAPGGTTGTHQCRVRPLDQFMGTRAKANFDGNLSWEAGYWIQADVQQDPSDQAAQQLAMQALTASESKGIKVNYRNNTDASQTTTRTYRAVFEKKTF